MQIPKKITKFLEKIGIKYETIVHRTVYTAYDKAATLRILEKTIGKTLILKMDKNYVIVLIPGNKNLDKDKFRKAAKVKSADFVKEAWLKKNFKGIKLGSIPPFGGLWKMPIFIDKELLKNQKIIVNSGIYEQSFKIKTSDLKKMSERLVIGSFSKIKK
jgi:Ala-tRNA(Pro) deacylase